MSGDQHEPFDPFGCLGGERQGVDVAHRDGHQWKPLHTSQAISDRQEVAGNGAAIQTHWIGLAVPCSVHGKQLDAEPFEHLGCEGIDVAALPGLAVEPSDE